VASLVLCSVSDQAAALGEMYRVLHPGGELRFYEHVVAETPRFAKTQRLVDPIWTRMAGGCHLDRDTAAAIAAAGFEIEHLRHFRFSASIIDRLASTQILGLARKPASASP
jgi:ubiquinone/menaquinone biosynthesis C-methylase UbiE